LVWESAKVFDYYYRMRGAVTPEPLLVIHAAEKLMPDDLINVEQMACSKRA
jgi:hypothetical protein